MKKYWGLKNVERVKNSVLTVGTFDGIHLGHQFILQEVTNRAKKAKAESTLVTFHPHPRLVLGNAGRPEVKLLTTIDEKVEILNKCNIDRLVIIEFTKAFSNTNARDFVTNILLNTIGFKEIVLGYDHAFGKNREGDIETLKNLARDFDFSVDELPPFKKNDTIISSTKIRKFLQEGDVKSANSFLGRHYALTGKVVKGDGRGKELNFPTANIEPESNNKLIPKDGVYAVNVFVEQQKYKGMLNIGMRPTFNSSKHTLEVHILNFDQDIYDKNLKVEFVDRIREERRFNSSGELVKQLQQDKLKSMNLLSD